MKTPKILFMEDIRVICNTCDTVFSQKGYLRIHKESVHGGNKFTCKKCDNAIQPKINLRSHNESVHGEKVLVWLVTINLMLKEVWEDIMHLLGNDGMFRKCKEGKLLNRCQISNPTNPFKLIL